MIGLPSNLDILNGMYLHIDIQLVDWIPEQGKRFGIFNKNLKFEQLIENSSKYQIVNKYRKTVHLGSYNELETPL